MALFFVKKGLHFANFAQGVLFVMVSGNSMVDKAGKIHSVKMYSGILGKAAVKGVCFITVT